MSEIAQPGLSFVTSCSWHKKPSFDIVTRNLASVNCCLKIRQYFLYSGRDRISLPVPGMTTGKSTFRHHRNSCTKGAAFLIPKADVDRIFN